MNQIPEKKRKNAHIKIETWTHIEINTHCLCCTIDLRFLMYMLMCLLGPMYGHVIHFFLFFCLVKLFFFLVCSYFYHYGE